MWVQSLCAEILIPLQYTIFRCDFNLLKQLFIPDYIEKICVIIDDADNIALDREDGNQETHKLLAWLDGSSNNFISSRNDDRLQIITIFTVNSSNRWDKAALRKGRINEHFRFESKGY